MNVLFPRDLYLRQLIAIDAEASARDMVRILTGVRRCGKSTLLHLYENHLLELGVPRTQIMSVNFEDLSRDNLRNPQEFHEAVVRAVEEHQIAYLHVDEVQELTDWARVLNSLREKYSLRITVTGSNASLFAGEGLTYLAGRYIALDVMPLSLQEYRQFMRVSAEVPNEKSYAQWMYGTLPAVALMHNSQVRKQAMNSVFDSIFARDIARRGQLRDTEAFIKVARFIFDTAGSAVSPGNISATLGEHGVKISPQTIDRFLELMVSAHMCYPCRRYRTRGKQWLRSNGKYYFVDPGLRDVLLGNKPSNTGHDLENMVFLELIRRGYQVSTAETSKGQIDFRAQRGEETCYLQVALTALDTQTLQRELRPFASLPAGSKCALVTMDRIKLDTGAVPQVNAPDFLAGGEL